MRAMEDAGVAALGLGFRRGCAPDALAAAIRTFLAERPPPAIVATLDRQGAAALLLPLATALGARPLLLPVAALLAETGRLTRRSAAVFRATGCHGVAEGAALAALGPTARLVLPRATVGGVVLALACAPVAPEAQLSRADRK